MWAQMMNHSLVNLKADRSCLNGSRTESQKVGYCHPIDKQNLTSLQLNRKVLPPQKQVLLPKTQSENLSDQCDIHNSQSKNNKNGGSLLTKTIFYKNEVESYKSKLFAAEYLMRNIQNQNKTMMECEKSRYERRIEELKNKLVEKDKQIRDKDQIIKKFIVITKNL